MAHETTRTRRQVLAALGTGAVGASAGIGTASGHGQERAENSIRIRYQDCETVRITGAQVLNERDYYAGISGTALAPEDERIHRVGFHWWVRPDEFEFPYEENVAEETLARFEERFGFEALGAMATRVVVRCCETGGSGERIAQKRNPDEDECWDALG